MDNAKALNDAEKAQLREYIDSMDALAAAEPAYTLGYNESAWESWNAQCVALNDKYNDLIIKALAISLNDWKDSPQSVTQILKSFLSDDPTEKAEAYKALHSQLESISQYGLMNDKVNREIISSEPATHDINGQLSMMWGVNKAQPDRPQVPVYIALSNESGATSTSKRITTKDDAIFTATANIIYALIVSGIQPPYCITPQDIWRQMNGKSEWEKPTSKQIKEICASIDKMRYTALYMDISAELKANYITIDDERVVGGIIDTYYLEGSKAKFYTEKNKELTGYSFDRLPFLYSYNIAAGHIILVDNDLLDTSDTTGNEGYTVEFRYYLLREIALMYRHERDSRKILYDTIYKSTGIPTPAERTQRGKYSNDDSYNSVIKREASKDRKKIASILQSWVNKNWILGFTQTKKGKSYDGIKIELNPSNYETKQITAGQS